jgi:hypothetical protein
MICEPLEGSVGDDNAMAESFFATLECELLDRRIVVFEFIEGFYNLRRRHSSLGYLSPIDYERRHDQRATDPSAHRRSAARRRQEISCGPGRKNELRSALCKLARNFMWCSNAGWTSCNAPNRRSCTVRASVD